TALYISSNYLITEFVKSGAQTFTGASINLWKGVRALGHDPGSSFYRAGNENNLINNTVDQLVHAMAGFNIDSGHGTSASSHMEPEGVGPVLAAALQLAA
ncbi:MAG: hypothetical protein ACRESK_04755, partial [Gammaproteobacteria bacterium]